MAVVHFYLFIYLYFGLARHTQVYSFLMEFAILLQTLKNTYEIDNITKKSEVRLFDSSRQWDGRGLQPEAVNGKYTLNKIP